MRNAGLPGRKLRRTGAPGSNAWLPASGTGMPWSIRSLRRTHAGSATWPRFAAWSLPRRAMAARRVQMMRDVLELDREARRRAVLPEGSFIVQAPAGSGKTTLLTLRYLRLLGDVERPEQIVAITFTRKAAAEMRHRIVAALALGAAPLATDADERSRELHRYAAAALARSRERGWGLEHNPARLHVQTIDG